MRSLDKLQIWHKLALVGGVLVLLFAVPTTLFLGKVEEERDRTRRALAGLDRAVQAVSLVRAVSLHRGFAAGFLSGDAGLARAREDARRDADQRFTQATAAMTDGAAASSRRLAATAQSWKSIADAVGSRLISPGDSHARHTEIIAQLQDVLESLVDEHALAADAEIRVHYAAMAAFLHAPQLAEALGRSRSLGMAMLGSKQGNPEDRQVVAASVDEVKERQALVKSGTAKALDRDGAMREKVVPAATHAEAEVVKAIRAARVDVVFGQALDSGAGAYGATMAAAVEAQERLVAALADEVRKVLQARAGAQQRQMILALLAAFAGLGGAIAFGVWTTRSIVRPLGFAVKVADEIAAGRLDHDIDPGRAHNLEAARLLAAFQSMQGGLSHLAREIQDAGHEIHRAAGQVALGNAELSSRTEEQASSLEQTAATMEQLTATVGSNAESARRAAEVVSGASEAATRGAEAVAAAELTMEKINAASKRIVDITAVIDTIAFQTNILALNAAVEAARAGEQGRGFAVVAAEVRSLAQRSAASAKEIKGLIAEAAGAAAQGSQRVDETGRAMDEIMDSVARVAQIFTEISAASAEQGHGIRQVNKAITQMDRVTQENAALVNEAAASSHSLQAQAGRLAGVAGRFRVSESAAAAPPSPAEARKPAALVERDVPRLVAVE
jgi:methyl-accepting chemotaxis protein